MEISVFVKRRERAGNIGTRPPCSAALLDVQRSKCIINKHQYSEAGNPLPRLLLFDFRLEQFAHVLQEQEFVLGEAFLGFQLIVA